MNSSEKNRSQNCLTVCNFKLDDVFSDVFGSSAARVLGRLLELGIPTLMSRRSCTKDAKPRLSKSGLRSMANCRRRRFKN
jgi:hypothetical protein